MENELVDEDVRVLLASPHVGQGSHLSVDSDEGSAYGESFPPSPRGAGTVSLGSVQRILSFGSWGYLAYRERFAKRRG